ncbi:hypothetical protein MPH_06697 [Macrophomina phaseolina MS6]|uniref:Uncharacterized protein n=1 Tax=Macrophomina phaseolina (strain MS6) TaxID=1126212 RepID=K2R1N9_MACPH|nr:hypothetical protein MPH_06697 [Macrophomina phaseolina MS6]
MKGPQGDMVIGASRGHCCRDSTADAETPNKMGKPTFELEPTVDEKKAYWNEKLRGVNSTPFPAVATWNTSVPHASTVHGSAVIQEGVGKAVAALDALVLASWALTVSTYMADSDVCFGVIAAHSSCSSQSVLMPRRLAIDGGMSTSQLLAHVRHESEYSNRFNMKIDDIASISHDTRRACQFGSVIALPSSPAPAGSTQCLQGGCSTR